MEHGVVSDLKLKLGVIVNGTSMAWVMQARKLLRFAPPKSKRIVGAFEDDGEAIDFKAGPMNDWRSPSVEALEPIERIKQVRKIAESIAMMSEEVQGKSFGMRMMVLTEVVVLGVGVMFFIAYFQKGGLPI